MRPTEPFSVLIADDNQDAADSLGIILELHGFAVRVVYDGTAALHAATSDPPDCAILDIGMPGMTGYEVAKALRANPTLEATRLIALSGWERGQFAAEGDLFDMHFVKGRMTPEELAGMLAVFRRPDAGGLDGVQLRPE